MEGSEVGLSPIAPIQQTHFFRGDIGRAVRIDSEDEVCILFAMNCSKKISSGRRTEDVFKQTEVEVFEEFQALKIPQIASSGSVNGIRLALASCGFAQIPRS